MNGERWIVLGAALVLGFACWLMHWHSTEIAPLRARVTTNTTMTNTHGGLQ